MRLVFILFTMAYINAESACAQQTKTTEHINRIWLGYLTQTRFSDHWGMWADFHLRTKENFVEGLSQSIIRLGATYYITDNTKLTLGYAYVNDFPGDNHKNISVPNTGHGSKYSGILSMARTG
jgi:hypothetical protein